MMSIKSKEDKSSGVKNEAAKSNNNGSGNGSTDSMSRVRRTGRSRTDSSGGLQLSELQSGDRAGSSEELRKRTSSLETGRLLAGIERQIAKINAYRNLLNKKISIKGTPPDLADEIITEYKKWVEDQVFALMGSNSKEISFTQEEIQTLKIVAEQVKQKMQSQPATTKASPTPHPPQRPSPLKDSVNVEEYRRHQLKVLEEVRKLEEMDRNSPTF